MLQHTPDPSQNAPDAAHTRVKVDVLARAIAAIEERRQEEARQREGTALVGDVVQDLHLDVTPEELLAEVQAQSRAAHTAHTRLAVNDAQAMAQASQQAARVDRQFLQGNKIYGLCGIAVLVVFWLIASHSPSATRPEPSGYQPPPLYSGPFVPVRVQKQPFLPDNHWLGMFPAGIGHDQNGSFHAIADVPDKEPFGVSLITLQRLLRHEPLNQIHLYDAERDKTYDLRRPDADMDFTDPSGKHIGAYVRSSWTLIKYRGQPYLRGWVEPDAAQQADAGKNISMFNVPAPAQDAKGFIPITVPLAASTADGLYVQTATFAFGGPTQGVPLPPPPTLRTQVLVVRGFRPDAHLWENWTP